MSLPYSQMINTVSSWFSLALNLLLGYVWFLENTKERKKNNVENYFL